MNKSVWVIVFLSVVLTSFVTYQVTVSVNSNTYVKKDELKNYFDQYLEQSTKAVFSAFVKGAKLQEQVAVEKKRQAIVDSQQALENDPATPFIGNEKGDVNIVMFSDYSCGFCKKSAPILEQVLKQDKNLKLIVKEFPILGPSSIVSAKVALAAYKLDKTKYASVHKQLFTKRLNSEKDLLQLAKLVGIDGKSLLLEMEKPEYNQIAEENQALASSLGVNGTPAFVIDGVLYPGALSEEQLKGIVKQVREKRLANKTK